MTRLTKFGAFVELAEGVEGLVHVSEISAERRINHPQDVLRVGERVKAQVLGVDAEKRQIRLSMKQLVPTGLGEYLEEHSVGDTVSGRVVEQSGGVGGGGAGRRDSRDVRGGGECGGGGERGGWRRGSVAAGLDAERAVEGWGGYGEEEVGAAGGGADSELHDCEAGP